VPRLNNEGCDHGYKRQWKPRFVEQGCDSQGPGPDEFQICTWTRGTEDAKVDVLVCSGLGESEEGVSEVGTPSQLVTAAGG